MKFIRSRWAAVAATACVIALATLIVRTVLDTQDRGRQALERNQRATVEQLAASMGKRVETQLESIGSFLARPFSLAVADPTDIAFLESIQALLPDVKSGMVLLDADGTVTNGTLLRDTSLVGTRLERPGLSSVLEGESAILPTARGVTTDLPTQAIAAPIRDGAGAVRGAFLFETVVAADSAFNQEIAELRQGETGRFTFVDELGTVVVSTDADLLGQPFDRDDILDLGAGFERIRGEVVAIANVESAGWRLIFTQDEDEFEAGLGQSVQSALLALILGALAAGALAFVAVLRRLRAEREERRRVEEVNATREEFVSIVSHELRTPVAGVVGFLQSALDHWDSIDDDARRTSVARAAANAQRLQALTRDVLDSTSLETGDLVYEYDLVSLAREVEAAVVAAEDLQPERAFSLTMADQSTWVRADADRIRQLMMNLLENAMKNAPINTPIEVRLTVEGSMASVAVTDHGPGLSAAEAETVFDKFVRGRSMVRGTGLGLYIGRRIIEAHGGTISVLDAGGAGATFVFTLPLTAPSDEVTVTA